jgi:hypothetical protein
MVKPAAGYRPLAYSSPEAVQTTGTVAVIPSDMGIRPAKASPDFASPAFECRPAGREAYRNWDLSSSHAPDTAEDSKPTAELSLLLRPVAALQPRISAAERSRSLYFRCRKQQKQLVLRVIHTIHQAMTHHRSYQSRYTGDSRCPRRKWIPPPVPARGRLRGKARRGRQSCIN